MKIGNILSQFMLYFFLYAMVWVGVIYVTQNIQYCNAIRYQDRIIMAIEDSDPDSETISKYIEEARENGYELKVERYSGANRNDAKVILSFNYTLPIFGVTKNYVLEGYAR